MATRGKFIVFEGIDGCGKTTQTELLRRRIAAAKKLLDTTDLPLAEIASRCGYCHASFFIRTFKKATGETPTAYRTRC